MPDAFVTEALNTPAATAQQLREHIDALRQLKLDIKSVQDAVALRLAQAKSEGFDKDVLKVLVKRLDGDRKELSAKDSLLRLYESYYHGDMSEEDAALLHGMKVEIRRGARAETEH